MKKSIKVLIAAVVLIILIGGGFFAWQYLGISEEKTTRWKEYKLEEITSDFNSPDFMDRRLIGIRDDGGTDIIIPSMKTLLGWEKIPGENTFYPNKVSFPPYSDEIFFTKFLGGTGHSAGLFILDVITLKSKQLTEVGPIYENYYNYLSLVSPDGFKIASYGDSDLYLLDLLQDKAILLVKNEAGETFYLAAETPEFQWLDDDTIQYPVHSAQDIYAPPIEVRKISIKTKEVKKVAKDEIVSEKSLEPAYERFNLTSPNGGEIWEIGKTYSISWEQPYDVSIWLEDWSSLPTKTFVINDNVAVPPYLWTIPSSISPGVKYKIGMRAYPGVKGATIAASSDDFFSIIQK